MAQIWLLPWEHSGKHYPNHLWKARSKTIQTETAWLVEKKRECGHVQQQILAADPPARVPLWRNISWIVGAAASFHTYSVTCCGFNAAFLMARKKNTSRRGDDGRAEEWGKSKKPKSWNGCFHCAARRRPFIGVTITDASLWLLPSQPRFFKDACQQHINNARTVAPTDRKLQRHMLSSLPRGLAAPADHPARARCKQTAVQERGFLTWAQLDLQLRRDWRKQWHQCEAMWTYRWFTANVCLSVRTHCAMCVASSGSQSHYCNMGVNGIGLLQPRRRHAIDYPKASTGPHKQHV